MFCLTCSFSASISDGFYLYFHPSQRIYEHPQKRTLYSLKVLYNKSLSCCKWFKALKNLFSLFPKSFCLFLFIINNLLLKQQKNYYFNNTFVVLITVSLFLFLFLLFFYRFKYIIFRQSILKRTKKYLSFYKTAGGTV